MKRWLLTLTVFLGAAPATASPAADLYRAATDIVQNDYYGWATADFSALKTQFAEVLKTTCQPEGETCSYGTGRQVLTALFEAYGDLHTNVRDPEAAERLREVMDDRAVFRTGLRTVRVEGGLLVVSVLSGSPAQQAGVQRFDLLTDVNGQPAGLRRGKNTQIGPADLIRLERQGQPINLSLRHAGQPRRTLNLTPQVLRARDEPTLTWADQSHQTALIDLPSFLASGTAARFLKTVQDAQAGGATNLIIDLRYNGGGNLTECVAAASVFGPLIYRIQESQGKANYYGLNGKRGDPIATEMAVTFPEQQETIWTGRTALLVGPNTASCAEVFSLYAQKNGAVVVGEKTKGVANSGVVFHDLPDGGMVAVTVLRAFAADHQPLPARVTPDVHARNSVTTLTLLGRDLVLKAALDAVVPVGGNAQQP